MPWVSVHCFSILFNLFILTSRHTHGAALQHRSKLSGPSIKSNSINSDLGSGNSVSQSQQTPSPPSKGLTKSNTLTDNVESPNHRRKIATRLPPNKIQFPADESASQLNTESETNGSTKELPKDNASLQKKNVPMQIMVKNKIDLNIVNASYDTEYREVVNRTTVWSFVFPGSTNKTNSVRVHVSASMANRDFPVLFVVEEQRGILSWQVPLILQNDFARYYYDNVSRILCPFGSLTNREIMMEVSTFSNEPVNFTVFAQLVELDITATEAINTTVTPSEPRYFRYTFPDDVNSVVVKAESEDDICMFFSIQEITCPVMDQVRNVEFTGIHQTVTRKGAVTVRRDQVKQGAFFVVVVPTPSDFECTQIEKIKAPLPENATTKDRTKQVIITVMESITVTEYFVGIIAAVSWFLGFYIMSFIIALVYHCIDHSRCSAKRNEEDGLESVSESENASLIVPGPSSHMPGPSALVPAATGGSHSYGAVDTGSDQGPGSTKDGIRQRNGNGPTVAIAPSPPNEETSSVSSIDESEIDMVHDVNQDKNIFRMKTYLYVSDLSRKTRKRLSKKFRLYPWNLMALAIFYALPVIQLVITYQKVLNRTGNLDSCYYNFYCAHPLHPFSTFNNVFSNIGYILLGLLFLILVYRRDIMHRRLMRMDARIDKLYGIPQHFGLFYTLGIALMMEGVLSACYHVCPSYNNFQFDTSFMYVIAWLLMLKIYQTRHPDINPHAHVAYFILAFTILFVVVGVVYGTRLFWIVFVVVYLSFYVILSLHVYYMGRWRLDARVMRRFCLFIRTDICACARPLYFDRLVLLLVGNAVNIFFAIYGIVTTPADFASYLLAIFIVNLLMYFAFYIIMKVRSGERLLPLPVMYTLMSCVVWGFAFYFFLWELTSWHLTPAQSREHNQNCVLLKFYDSHDIWHFLSATGMFLSFMMLLTLDDDLIHTPRDKIRVF